MQRSVRGSLRDQVDPAGRANRRTHALARIGVIHETRDVDGRCRGTPSYDTISNVLP
jgi:hypothetical protein